jgi:hypothetical protein
MTEQEWLNGSDPVPLLRFLSQDIITLVDEVPEEQREKMRQSISRLLGVRKRLLFACACCRTIWNQLEDERSRIAVDLLEQYADGLVGPDAHGIAMRNALSARDAIRPNWRKRERIHDQISRIAASAVCEATSYGLESTIQEVVLVRLGSSSGLTVSDVKEEHVKLLHDILGNPFQPIITDPNWLSSNVRVLAEGIYDDRAFDQLPILYDALLDAGCNHEDILQHCRSEEPHVRGCWVIDLLLGKE